MPSGSPSTASGVLCRDSTTAGPQALPLSRQLSTAIALLCALPPLQPLQQEGGGACPPVPLLSGEESGDPESAHLQAACISVPSAATASPRCEPALCRQGAQSIPDPPAHLPGHVCISHHIFFPQDCSAQLPTNRLLGQAALHQPLDQEPPQKALWEEPPCPPSAPRPGHLGGWQLRLRGKKPRQLWACQPAACPRLWPGCTLRCRCSGKRFRVLRSLPGTLWIGSPGTQGPQACFPGAAHRRGRSLYSHAVQAPPSPRLMTGGL